MCAVDGRQRSKNISSANSRLSKLYSKISKKIEKMIELTSSAESFYTATDSASYSYLYITTVTPFQRSHI